MGEIAVVATEDEELAAMSDGGVSPSLPWMVGLLWLEDPLQLFKFSTVSVALHATF